MHIGARGRLEGSGDGRSLAAAIDLERAPLIAVRIMRDSARHRCAGWNALGDGRPDEPSTTGSPPMARFYLLSVDHRFTPAQLNNSVRRIDAAIRSQLMSRRHLNKGREAAGQATSRRLRRAASSVSAVPLYRGRAAAPLNPAALHVDNSPDAGLRPRRRRDSQPRSRTSRLSVLRQVPPRARHPRRDRPRASHGKSNVTAVEVRMAVLRTCPSMLFRPRVSAPVRRAFPAAAMRSLSSARPVRRGLVSQHKESPT